MSATVIPHTTTSITTWKIDPAHSVAEFKVKHMMIAYVKGYFSQISGTLALNESDVTQSHVEALIDAGSVDTHSSERDAHLRGADFLDVEKFQTLYFKSEQISNLLDGKLSMEGDLSIHGVTRKVIFTVEGPTSPAKDPWGNTRVGVSATTKINRKEYGLTWNAVLETGGVLIGDEITITLDVEFVRN